MTRMVVRALSLVILFTFWTAPLALAAGDGPWVGIKDALFDERPIKDGAGVIRLEAPDRAADAALVPIKLAVELPLEDQRHIKTIHLIIDRNPAPVAGIFHLQGAHGVTAIATRVRVNEYTDVRAIAETSDGELFMASRFVKAAGGCSAPAMKNHDLAMARLGKMKLKTISPFVAGEPHQVELMISHPNYSGLQIDQVSRNWIPPHFVDHIALRYGNVPLIEVEGDISLSENPTLRISFVPEAPAELQVEATDTEDAAFSNSWPLGGQPSS